MFRLGEGNYTGEFEERTKSIGYLATRDIRKMKVEEGKITEDSSKTEKKENQEKSQMTWMPICMCLGLSIGMSLGSLMFDNMSIGMCMGISLGVAVGSIIDATNRAKNRKDSEHSGDSDQNKEDHT